MNLGPHPKNKILVHLKGGFGNFPMSTPSLINKNTFEGGAYWKDDGAISNLVFALRFLSFIRPQAK